MSHADGPAVGEQAVGEQAVGEQAVGEQDSREAIVHACASMNATGLNQGTSGNISVRSAGGFLITPSGVPYDRLAPHDIVAVTMDGRWQHALAPSSEWRIHRDLYRSRADLGAVVHAHPTYCTALAMRGMPIPAVHYMIAVAGGASIRCAPYATFGTPELSEHAVRAMDGRLACLLANHGMIAGGSSLGRAMWVANEVETLARQYVHTLMLGDRGDMPINVLPDDEIERVVAKFADYGPRSHS